MQRFQKVQLIDAGRVSLAVVAWFEPSTLPSAHVRAEYLVGHCVFWAAVEAH